MSRWLVLLPVMVLPFLAGTASGAQRDRDRDGLPDRWEKRYHLSTSKKSARGDADRDGLRNRREYRLRTNPRKKDTDGDGLRDRAEVRRYRTNPRKKDTDGDGRSDGLEVRTGTNPRKRDAAASHPPDSPSATPAPAPSTPPFTPTPEPPLARCDLNATPATFASQVSAATSGQGVCLATGSYGTFAGTNKAITIRPADGATATMRVTLGSGDSGFTLDGLSGMGGVISGGARDITIRRSAFTSSLDVQGTPGANILLDRNTHDWPAVYDGGLNAKLFVYSTSGGASSGVTVSNSSFRNGDLDGIHVGSEAGLDIIGNTFMNLCDTGTNHTDNIQTEGMVGGRIAGNHISAPSGCATQGLTSYDSLTVGVLIEDNVVDIRRPWGIEWYSDRDSIIRHNTVVYHPDSECMFSGPVCGQIDINRRAEDPAGTGTQVYDNLTSHVSFNNGSTGTAHHNMSPATVSYVGPLTSWAGFELAPGSPGTGAASDGWDAGIRVP